MTLPDHKTKIVATIGPASDTPEMLERYRFTFPLLGNEIDDEKLAAGLSARTRVLVPHREGVRELAAARAGSAPVARWRVGARRAAR